MKSRNWIAVLGLCALAAIVAAPNAGAQSVADEILAMGEAINAELIAQGAEFRLDRAEYLTESDEIGQTVYFDDRTKQLSGHWVPGDPRRGGGTDIAYIVDQVDAATVLPVTATTPAIDAAMITWNGVDCSEIPITKVPDIPGLDVGVIEWIYFGGGSPLVYADLQHAGWVPWLQYPVLGVTFTFIWIDGDGNPTDIDNNGKTDVALREIYYADIWYWAVDGIHHPDVETVALHEVGHGLSQGHFGKLFRTDANGKLHFAPMAVMNAGYTGFQRQLTGTDNAGHCSIWGSWPNN